ncbi:unnamed protein product [Allacma fusca]|uniref:Uncharacterized protein n=1 Tax=Allacma fusca TaxID=39272 RepID=A0A8J2PXA4_9HEXA|nr:unnamed protein product [Allacma fusca]
MAAFLRCLIPLVLAYLVSFTAAKENSILLDESSCAGRCPGEKDEGIAGECSCAKTCMKNLDCCEDYFKICHGGVIPTCKGMCLVGRTPDRPCDCSPECIEADDCCPDYNEQCLMETVSDQELKEMTESLLFWEDASLWKELDINLREQTNDTTCDAKPNLSNLLRFKNPPRFSPTYQNLILLYNDFNPNITEEEKVDIKKINEQGFFQSSLLDTRSMKAVANFLIHKKFISKEIVFPRKFQTMWFDTYKRSSKAAPYSSSGFEHVFLGEIEPKKETIGFHNWFYLMNEQNERTFNYHGHFNYLELNKKASVISINFDWKDHCKTRSSMFIGTSPEFEFALYTLCWFTRPGQLCPVVLGGKAMSIQTYVHTNQYGTQFVAAAYPVLSDSTAIPTSSKLILGFALIMIYFRQG